MAADVRAAIRGHVGICTIDSPATRNAAEPALVEALAATLEQLDGDPAVRCIVLTGSAETFATGPDIRALAGPGTEPAADVPMAGFWARLRAIDTPIVAAVNGWALAFGFELALACDLVVVGPETAFGVPEVTLGLIPAGGAGQRLARLIGKQRTMELVLTGRRISGRQAFEWGVANVLAGKRRCLEQATVLAEEIAERPPRTLRIAKRAIVAADEHHLEAGLAHERELFAAALASADRVEAINALLEGRPADHDGDQ